MTASNSTAHPQKQVSPRLVPYLVVGLLLVQALLLGYLAIRQSPNANEPGHLAAGVSNWQLGRFELYRVNPPLVRMVGALPVVLSEVKTDWSEFHDGPGSRPVFTIGPDFIKTNGERSFWLMTLARWACIPFSLIGSLVCFFWARALYGEVSGLLALTIWCFSPNILAHGAFITPDAGATAMAVTAAWLFWRWLQHPTWGRVVAAGCVLGLAELTKSTLILFFGLWPCLWFIWIWLRRSENVKPAAWRQGFQLAVLLLLALHILNLGYGYDGSFRPLGSYEFVSATLGRTATDTNSGQTGNRFQGTWLEKIPVPLPAQYVIGIDVQKQDFERERQTFFRGKLYSHGFWYYYLYALAIKVPLGTWLLALLAAACTVSQIWRGQWGQWRDEIILLAPLILILVFVSSETDYNAHLRYILPIFPFAIIWISKSALIVTSFKSYRSLVIAVPLLWSVASSLWVYPYSLAYFNELIGGPSQGYRHLINSNLDWGQDLHDLKRWLDRHPSSEPFYLAYYGLFAPQV
ncbi:MAG: glycosyltransferase family 39 protein, partial [Planctomycetaceae bacterium]|nr:glycosyltransferase family 39 protein [Planctomycetaceae bacterium]